MKSLTMSFLCAATLALGACSDGNGPGGAANVQVSFATQAPTGASVQRVALADTIVTGTDILVVSRARLVLREVELRRAAADSCIEEDDACEEFETGPVLVDLPVDGSVRQQFALDIPPDTYTEIEFDLHEPDDDDPADQTFIQANPAFADISVRVEGTFNGRAFVYTSDLNAEQELPLVPALVVEEGVATNVTVFVDLSAWFRTAGGALVDPETANEGGVNENLVRDNIEDSFEAFEDDDRDGDDDDDD